MPELPEVETIRRGIEPLILRREITRVEIRSTKLRWPVPEDLGQRLVGLKTAAVERRGKYLLVRFSAGTLLIHLGMSGVLRVITQATDAGLHDHADIWFSGGICLHFNDPRRFGALLWIDTEPSEHPLLSSLGPEPLSGTVDGTYLFQRSRTRRIAIKSLIMDHRVVAGIGNIYASEALFKAGIHPARPAGNLSPAECGRLAGAILQVLEDALAAGGTTLGAFKRETGRPGYFSLHLEVYGRAGLPCGVCGSTILNMRLGQRSSFFCPVCQT